MERDALSLEPMVYSFIYICQSPQKEPSHKMQEKYIVTVHGAPHERKAYLQWGVVWFPKGIINDTAIITPEPCSLQHDTFHLGVGRPEPCYSACIMVTLNKYTLHIC